ncbi:type II toxin-antitoxin system YafQ family toxin [Ligilactobacillus murinus]|nr:type II toxin-antitoxin system YafQ family toxin [Ligilactobacillus murinus]
MSLLNVLFDALRQGKTLAEKYHNYQLTGEFIGYYECHIKPDWLLIYLVEDDIMTLSLINTGSYSDLF